MIRLLGMIFNKRQGITPPVNTLDREPTRKEIGDWGEAVAVNWLQREAGFRIIQQNWSYKNDEIDIIARQDKMLVFVEIRTRSQLSRIPGYETVGIKKKKALLRVCKAYLRFLKEPPANYRFDIVAISYHTFSQYEVRHYENVTLFPRHSLTG